MIDNKIVGKYWLCRNESGSLWLVQGRKPVSDNDGGYIARYNKDSMHWLELTDDEDYSVKDGVKVRSTDYAELDFPSITYEDGPLEIEIGRSGKVYYYED